MNARTRCLFLFAVVAGVMSVGTSGRDKAEEMLSPGPADSQGEVDVLQRARGMNAFACDLYGRLRSGEGNLFLSPYSISTALAMAYGGSAGKTRAQMRTVLHAELPDERLHRAVRSLTESVVSDDPDQPYHLDVANALWFQDFYPLRRDFIGLIRKQYAADLHRANFIIAPAAAAREINHWVADRTRGRISRVVQPGTFNELTRVVLVNAIDFKGEWASRFAEEDTEEMPFTLLPSDEAAGKADTVAVPMMRQRQEFPCMSSAEMQLLVLPYRRAGLAMLVLLPRRGEDGKHTLATLRKLEESLTPDTLNAWVDQMRYCDVTVTLPKFTITRDYALNSVLESLGMTDAFVYRRADFSGMDGTRELFIQSVNHAATVEVDEEGSTASAATTMSIGCGAPPLPMDFHADHPFLFMICHLPTRSILFMGRVMDPSAG